MVTLLLFLCIFGLLFWVASLGNRLENLERLFKGKGVFLPQEPHPDNKEIQPVVIDPVGTQTQLQTNSQDLHVEEKVSKNEEELTAGLLNKIGVVALILGMGFFFKYAIDQGWISEWTRVLIGFMVSGLLVYLGELFKDKYGSRALGLAGGGIGIWYFTVYAAFNFYQLFSQPLAFLLMLVGVGIAIWLSYRHKSLSLTILGFVGAYAAPMIFAVKQDQQTFLFVYLIILSLANLVVLAKNYEDKLVVLSFLGTVIDFVLWTTSYSTTQNTIQSLVFVVMTTCLYAFVINFLFCVNSKRQTVSVEVGNNLAALNIIFALFYFVSFTALLHGRFYDLLAPISLLGSVVFFIAYAFVDRLNFRSLNYCLAFIGTTLLVSAAIWRFDKTNLTWLIMLISLCGFLVGYWLKREELRFWGLVALFFAFFRALFEPYASGLHAFLFNEKFTLMLATAVLFIFYSWVYSQNPVNDFEKKYKNGLLALAVGIIWFAVSWEIYEFYKGLNNSNSQNLFLTFWWIIYAVIVLAVGSVIKLTVLRKLAILLFGLCILKVFLYDVQTLETPYRVIAFIVLGVILLTVSFVYQKNKEKIIEFLLDEPKT